MMKEKVQEKKRPSLKFEDAVKGYTPEELLQGLRKSRTATIAALLVVVIDDALADLREDNDSELYGAIARTALKSALEIYGTH